MPHVSSVNEQLNVSHGVNVKKLYLLFYSMAFRTILLLPLTGLMGLEGE